RLVLLLCGARGAQLLERRKVGVAHAHENHRQREAHRPFEFPQRLLRIVAATCRNACRIRDNGNKGGKRINQAKQKQKNGIVPSVTTTRKRNLCRARAASSRALRRTGANIVGPISRVRRSACRYASATASTPSTSGWFVAEKG